MLNCRKTGFGVSLPHVVFTDDDYVFRSALSTMSESRIIIHLMCTNHVFDLNAKRHISSVFCSKKHANTWLQFRKGLARCRESTTEEMMQVRWRGLIDEWLPNSEKRYTKAREYLEKNVWSKRKRWAVCYFKLHNTALCILEFACQMLDEKFHFILGLRQAKVSDS